MRSLRFPAWSPADPNVLEVLDVGRRMARLIREHGRIYNLARLGDVELLGGGHEFRGQGCCLMELVAWAAGEEHSFLPRCCCPLLCGIGNRLNDSLGHEPRQGLKQLVPYLLGTASTPVEIRIRAHAVWMHAIVRRYLPDWRPLHGPHTPEFIAVAASDRWPPNVPFDDLVTLAEDLARCSVAAAVEWFRRDETALPIYLDHIRELCLLGRPLPTPDRRAA